MKNIALILFFLVFPIITYSQEKIEKFGKIDSYIKNLNRYESDTSAKALIIFDVADVSFKFEPNGRLFVVLNRHQRIKIFNKDASDIATYRINFIPDETSPYFSIVDNINASTFNTELGNTIESKLDINSIFENQINPDLFVKIFTLPNIKDGSIIDVMYTVTSAYIFDLFPWEFQYDYPALINQYTIVMPDDFQFNLQVQGNVPAEYIRKGNQRSVGKTATKHSWTAKHIPAFEEEVYISSRNDFIAKFTFSVEFIYLPKFSSEPIINDWKQISRYLNALPSFGASLTDSAYLINYTKAFTDLGYNDLELAKKIYYDLQAKLRVKESKSIFLSRDLKEAFDEKACTQSELNLILVHALRVAGLSADIQLISRLENGVSISSVPLLQKFDYVIAHLVVDDVHYFLDASDPLLPFGMLLPNCYNGLSRVISTKSTGTWFDMDSRIYTDRYKSFSQLELDKKNNIKGKYSISFDGFYAYLNRSMLKYGDEKEYKSIYQSEKFKEVNVSNFKIENTDDLEKSLVYTFDIDFGQENDAILYVQPFKNDGILINPFTKTTRLFPIDYGLKFDIFYVYNLKIPEGYVIDELPESINLTTTDRGMFFLYNSSSSNNSIQIVNRFYIEKAVFDASLYNEIKNLYDQAIAKQAEYIVIKKIK